MRWRQLQSQLLLAALLTSRSRAQTAPNDSAAYRPIAMRPYLLSAFGPEALAQSLAVGAFDQWRGQPRELPGDFHGFLERSATQYAQGALAQTIEFGADRMLHEHPLEYRSQRCGSAPARLTFALLTPLRVQSPSGAHLSVMGPLAEVASGVAVSWYVPARLRVREGVSRGVSVITSRAVLAVVREFWPWRWRPPFL